MFVRMSDGAAGRSITSEETRPLALQAAGSEIAATVVSRTIFPVIEPNGDLEQIGFVAGRSFVHNLWEWDSELRILSASTGYAAPRGHSSSNP